MAIEKYIALYIRVSTDEQVKEGISIDEQENRLKSFCISQGWENYVFYIENGFSAKNIKRPELQKLLRDVKLGKVSKVVVTKIDRFTRNLKDMLDLVNLFDTYSVSFCSSTESFDTSTAAGRMMLSILTTFAQFERERISERVTENMIFNAKNGKIQTQPCFGFKIMTDELTNEKIFVPDKYEAKWGSEIFKLFVEQNWGYMKIAKYLNKNEVKTKRNSIWSMTGVKKILLNELYVGRLVWNKRNAKGDKIKFRDKSEWIIIDNACDPIVPEELFQLAQLRISGNLPRGRYENVHLLTGIIKCGLCGSNMVSTLVKIKNNGETIKTYMCGKYRRGQGCSYNYIKMDEMNIRAINDTKNYISKINELTFEEKLNIDLDSLNKELDSIKGKIDLQLQLLEKEEITLDEFRIARNRLNKQKDDIQHKINLGSNYSNTFTVSLEDEILPSLENPNTSMEENRKHLMKIIKCIYIYKDKPIEIIFH